MSLKIIMLDAKAKNLRGQLEEMETREEELAAAAEEVKAAIEEADTEEELEAVNGKADETIKAAEELEEEKKNLEEKLKEIEEEIEALQEKDPEKDERSSDKIIQTRGMGGHNMKVNKFETREQMLSRINIDEVRSFYDKVAQSVREKRALKGGEHTIPTQVVDMIQRRAGELSKLYKHVNVIKLNGEGRVIVNGAIPEAVWVECCDALKEMELTLDPVELDCFKVGGHVPVCNAILEDSYINLANALEYQMALSVANALDKAILTGTGEKQPTGITKEVEAVTVKGGLPEVLGAFGQIGDEDEELDDMIAVMNRKTYYTYFATQLIRSGSQGEMIVQNPGESVLPDGTRVVLSKYAPADTVIVGDFKRYVLGERAKVTFASSEHAQFAEDNTVFKIRGRYDGKPANKGAFGVIKIEKATVGE